VSETVAIGYARAREITATASRSFYAASIALPRASANAAFALYAFLRQIDDAVDEHGAAPELLDQIETLARNENAPVPSCIDQEVHAAFAETARRHQLPAQPLVDLVEGMRMDTRASAYRTFAEVDVYCYRVAGTVGLLMARILGASASADGAAVALGKAMQLTNILRDVREDAARGRCYLPSDELAAYGVGALECIDDAWRAFMRMQVARARAFYTEAEAGIALIPSRLGRWCVRMMAAIYADILRVIEARDYDVFNERARVSGLRKLWLMLRSLR
jgi:phytoene synthase